MQDRGGGDTAGQSMQEKFHRVGTFVIAQQNRGLTIGEDEVLVTGFVFSASAVESADDRAIFPTVHPFVTCPELELRERWVVFQGLNGLAHLDQIKAVAGLNVHLCVHFSHLASSSKGTRRTGRRTLWRLGIK